MPNNKENFHQGFATPMEWARLWPFVQGKLSRENTQDERWKVEWFVPLINDTYKVVTQERFHPPLGLLQLSIALSHFTIGIQTPPCVRSSEQSTKFETMLWNLPQVSFPCDNNGHQYTSYGHQWAFWEFFCLQSKVMINQPQEDVRKK